MASTIETGSENRTRPTPFPRPQPGRHRYVHGKTGAQHHAPYVVKVNQPVAGPVAVDRHRRAARFDNGSAAFLARVRGGAA